MQYDYYLSTADDTRKDAAQTGLMAGTLTLEELTNTSHALTAIIASDSKSGRHGYEVSIKSDGMECGCKDYEFHGRKYGTACKHLIAAMLADQVLQSARVAA